jgi:hypothetical protein
MSRKQARKLRRAKINKWSLRFYTFKIDFKKNNIFVTLSKNKVFFLKKSFGYCNYNKDFNFIRDILDSFIYIFINSKYFNPKYSFFIFEILGLKFSLKRISIKLIINFLKTINFFFGTLYFVEGSSYNHNGCRLKKKRRKKFRK